MTVRVAQLIVPTLAAAALCGAPGAAAAGASTPGATASSGGAGIAAAPTPTATAPPTPTTTAVHPVVRGSVAKIIHGVAYAPASAPIQVQRAIWAGNQIRTKPYIYGGGHGSFNDRGYDCSGSVSYVLHAARLIRSPLDSSSFMSWGSRGLGRWITVYTNPGHAFVQIAGIRFDTSREADPHPAPGTGPRWRPLYKHPYGFSSRHPSGL